MHRPTLSEICYYAETTTMPDTTDDLIVAARRRVQERLARGSHPPDYNALVDTICHSRAPERVGVGGQIAKVQNLLTYLPPQRPTVKGRILGCALRVLGVCMNGALRLTASQARLGSTYDAIIFPEYRRVLSGKDAGTAYRQMTASTASISERARRL